VIETFSDNEALRNVRISGYGNGCAAHSRLSMGPRGEIAQMDIRAGTYRSVAMDEHRYPYWTSRRSPSNTELNS
jgi:hypothetical protein